MEAHHRKRLEQLCRYVTRPALSYERVQLKAAAQVELKLKTPWRDGTTHPVMSPLEFVQRWSAASGAPCYAPSEHCPHYHRPTDIRERKMIDTMNPGDLRRQS